MAPSFSKPMGNGNGYHAERKRHMKRAEEVWAPPILFNETNKGDKKDNDDDDDKSKFATFKVPFSKQDGNANGDSSKKETWESKVPIFKSGTPEEYINFRKNLETVSEQLDYTDTEKKTNVVRSLLGGKSLKVFESGLKLMLDLNIEYKDSTDVDVHEMPESEVLERALNELSKEVFDNWEAAYQSQKRYLKSDLVMDFDQDPGEFCDRLEELNDGFPYYPRDTGFYPLPHKKMDEEELVFIVDKSKKPDWEIRMLEQGVAPWNFNTMAEIKTFFKQLYRADRLKRKVKDLERNRDTAASKRSKDDNKEKNNTSNKKAKKSHDKKKNKDPPSECPHCNKKHYNHDGCWTLDKNKDKRPSGYKG